LRKQKCGESKNVEENIKIEKSKETEDRAQREQKTERSIVIY